MKCKYCDGTGTTNWCVNGTFLNCPHCGGTGEVEMTNEEYIHSLNTEGLARLLYEYRYDNATPQQRLWLSANEEYCKKCIVGWLKEKHTGGES